MSPRFFLTPLCCGVLTFLLYLSCPSRSFAQQKDAPDSAHYPKPSLDVPRRHGEITIDGDLSDSGWIGAAHTTQFSGALPIAFAKPQVETEAYITYDDSYLYFAMIAHDPNPSAIRASIAPRDRMFDEDFMGLVLDTYGDATKAFEIYANALGVEGDLFWSGNNEDDTYNLLYDVESRITKDGWQAEFRIPFRSLRFPNVAQQHFHATFWRNYPRESVYKFSWAPINVFEPCFFCQLGELNGISNIVAPSPLELLPGVVASESGTVGDPSDGNVRFENGRLSIKPSCGIRYALGPATGVEATINPDFSQVEADASQMTANQTFALFYPEHRPFFQDGSDLLNTYLSAVYTRSINNPLAAAKLLRRDEGSSLAILSGFDRNSPVILPLEEKSIIIDDAGKSLSNIVRATNTLGSDTYIGLLATDKRYIDGGSNSVAGFDTRVRLYENIEFLGQALLSYTKESRSDLVTDTDRFDGGLHTVAYDGENYFGDANYFALERFSPTFDIHVEYGQTSPTFRAANGFVFSNDYRGTSGWIGYKYHLKSQRNWFPWLTEVDGTLSTAQLWNYGGDDRVAVDLKSNGMRAGLDFDFIGQTDAHVWYRPYTERFAGVTFGGLHQFDVRGQTHFAQEISFGGEITVGRIINRDPIAPATGRETDASCYARLKPIGGLLLEPSYAYSRLDSLSSSGTFYSGSIYILKGTYQFSRKLDVRLIVQYDEFTQVFIADPLLTYSINPFTSFYIGSTHNFATIDSDPKTLRPTERQFFAKFQYLLQF